MDKSKKHAVWVEAKKRCRLNQADIQMTKELGMKPKSLIKNIPSPKQKWKAPVKVWVRELYEEKFGKVLYPETSGQSKKAKQMNKPSKGHEYIPDNELPF